MFREESYAEAKVQLQAHNDALNCLRESAERKMNIRNYEKLLQIIINAKKARAIEFKYEEVQKGPKFTTLNEIKLYQFSNFVFKKYLGQVDDYSGDYEGFKKILNEGLFSMQKDFDATSAKKR